jgi:hypothetical protein
MGCYCGDLREGERVLAPLRAFGIPIVDTIGPMPFPVMQTLADEGARDGVYNYWRSALVKELDDELLDLVVEYGNRSESPLTGTIVQIYGAAASRVGDADTAFAQPRR